MTLLAQSLFVVSLDGGEARDLTDGFEASATDLVWLGDGELLLVAAEKAQHALYRVDVTQGIRSPVAWSDLIVADMDKAAGQPRLALPAHSPRTRRSCSSPSPARGVRGRSATITPTSHRSSSPSRA